MSPINVARVAKLLPISLTSGKHKSIEIGACVMEAVAYVAGERSALELVDRMIRCTGASDAPVKD